MDNIAVNNKYFLMKEYLRHLLSQKISKEAILWLDEAAKSAASPENEIQTYQAFSRTPSVTGKNKLKFSRTMLDEAREIRKGWDPSEWRADQAARIMLLLSLPSHDPKEYKMRLGKFFDVADVNELQTLCLGLPLYPYPEKLIDLAIHGLRSNMKVVFEAIALTNPFPAEYFDIHAWNQMVLKALFVESPVYKIHGIDERANANLACMLSDYAHERWAAGRKVNPELWRCTGPYMNNKIFKDILRVFQSSEQIDKDAAALTCFMSKHPGAHQLLEEFPAQRVKIMNKEINWLAIGKMWHGQKSNF